MPNPFEMQAPTFLSVSGGRTSMCMLRRCLDAHGGTLPPGVEAVFCNTGKEHAGTLDFVERCSAEWDVPITWLEFRWEPGRYFYAAVDYATASRQGEPFDQLITAYRALPNQFKRSCTTEMKVRTLNRYATAACRAEVYYTALGLRADEEGRVCGIRESVKHHQELTLFGWDAVIDETERDRREIPIFPLFDGGVTKADVTAFWGGNRLT